MARSSAVRALLVAAAVVPLLLGPVGSAGAHDVLLGTTPVQDATVQSAPAAVALEFSDAPQSLGTEVAVTGPDAAPVAEGAPVLAGTTVTQPLAVGLPAGTYRVVWRATSADGHPLAGSFGFAVAQGAAVPMDRNAAPPTAAGTSLPVVWLAVAAIGVVAGGLVIRQLRRPA
jgi:methionine-rich copper-binding protein CopC